MSKPLLLNGKVFDPFKPTPAQLKVKDFLEKNPDEVFSRQELCNRAQVGKDVLYHFRTSAYFAKYVLSVPERLEKTVYGVPQALKRYQDIIAGRQ